MFCSYCGTKMDEGAKFCSTCGALMSEPSAPETSVPSVQVPAGQDARPKFTMPTFSLPSGDVIGTIKGALNAFGAAKMWLVIAFCTLFVSPIIGAFHGVSGSVGMAGVTLGTRSASWFDLWFGNGDGAGFGILMWIVGILLLIVAEAVMVYPLLNGTEYPVKSLRLAKIVGIGLAAFLVLSDIFMLVEGQESAYYSYALTFWGWLLHINVAALLVSVFKFSGYLKSRPQ